MNTAYQILHFVQYAAIRNWSVQYMIGGNFGYSDKYPLARIGSFLKRSRNVIDIEDEVEYKQVTVRTNNGGVCLRDKKRGKDIGTKKQNRVSKGQYIVSKIDARNGAFGIIPNELDGAIVTNDFPVFDVDNTIINTEFLLLVTTTKPFVAFAQSCSSGTTNRRRIDIDKFLEQEIPLPSLEEQNRLVQSYNNYIDKILEIEQTIKGTDAKAKQYIRKALELNKEHGYKDNKLLRFIRFKDTIIRWDTYAIKEQYKSKWPIVRLGEFISSISTGTTPPTNHKEYFNGNIKFYTPADISGEMYLGDAERHISQAAVDKAVARVYGKGTILFVGIGSTVGKVGIVNEDMVSSNQQITGFMVDERLMCPEYVYCFLHYNKDISTAEQSKTTLPIVNQSKISKIPIPIPPKEIQEGIVSYVSAAKARIHELQTKAASLKVQALQDFEHALFKQ